MNLISICRYFHKLFLPLIVWTGGSSLLFAQNIPDPNFAQAIRGVCPTCIDGSNNLLPPAASLTSLDISNKNIYSA